MQDSKILDYLQAVVGNMPSDWLRLTTHRLDIYKEELAKTEFLEYFEKLFQQQNAQSLDLKELPTAFDYIRLGHPLSCVLEWAIAKSNGIDPHHVISFSSRITPILAVLRKNLLDGRKTKINYIGALPDAFDADALKDVYGYQFELQEVAGAEDVQEYEDSNILVVEQKNISEVAPTPHIDFYVSTHPNVGSIILVNGASNENYVSEIQHVRRRETIAMTPANCLAVLNGMIGKSVAENGKNEVDANKAKVLTTIQEITGASANAVVGSSGLSIQYAIAMGLVDHALENHPGKPIRFVVPPNCYGGTNDQARRVAACSDQIAVVDLPVDGGQDMVQSIEKVLTSLAAEDAVPYIIAEIPTNPRVEVPDLVQLKEVLSKARKTPQGANAIAPVFILDQTFCPNVHFLREEDWLSEVSTIAYISGSKFPSGGLCTAGYATANQRAANLMDKIDKHLNLCDNEATPLQYEILAKQMPSMNQRIEGAYQNTRAFVNFVSEVLPGAKINFVSEELAAQGFTPSVFSLDLPTKGETEEERETYKRELNLQLINLMIGKIPEESKFCVSYGQLKGCYWTIPATSTQGTTKEGDKDYIVRVALSADMDRQRHETIFQEFVDSI